MEREKEIYQRKKNEVTIYLDKELQNDNKTYLLVSKNTVEDRGYVKEYLSDNYRDSGINLDLSKMDSFDILNDDSIEELIKDKYKNNTANTQQESLEKKSEVKNEEKQVKKTKRGRIGFFDFFILLIGIACIAVAYLGFLEELLSDNTNFTNKQIFAINVALYALGGLWVLVFIVSLFDSGKSKSKNDTKKISQLKDDTNNGKSSSKRKSKKAPSSVIVITGLNSYIDRYEEVERERVIDRVKFEFTHLYSWLKTVDDCELIVVWNSKVFITADLTLLVFDQTLEINNDYEEVEKSIYFNNRLIEEGILISASHSRKFANELENYKDIDFLVDESASVFSGISENVDGIKLVFVQYLKNFEKEKFDLLTGHFEKKETPVRISRITISKSDFELYSGSNVSSFNLDDLEKQPEFNSNFDSLKFPKLVCDDDFDFVNAKIDDDYSALTSYIKTLPEQELYKYCNLDLINNLIQSRETTLVKQLMHSLLNVEFSQCANYLKVFYNGLVKNEKENGCQSSARLLRYFYETVIDLEDGRDSSYASGNTDLYKKNRTLIFKMIEYVHKNARKFEYIKLNDEHASEIIFRKDI